MAVFAAGGRRCQTVRWSNTVVPMGPKPIAVVGMNAWAPLESHMPHQPSKSPQHARMGWGSRRNTAGPIIGLPPESSFRLPPEAATAWTKLRRGFAAPASHTCLSRRSPNTPGDDGKEGNSAHRTTISVLFSLRMVSHSKRETVLCRAPPADPPPEPRSPKCLAV